MVPLFQREASSLICSRHCEDFWTQSVKRAANLTMTQMSFEFTQVLSEAQIESQEWNMYLSLRCLLSSLEQLRRLERHKILLAESRRLRIFCQKSFNAKFQVLLEGRLGTLNDVPKFNRKFGNFFRGKHRVRHVPVSVRTFELNQWRELPKWMEF